MMSVTERLFDLITENESIEGLLKDLTDGGGDWQLKALSNPTFVGLESLVENQCRLTGSAVSITSANILCSVLKSSFAKPEQKLFLETSEERAKLNVIINVGKHFASHNKFSSRVFAKNLNKKDETYIPFEVIWMLHKHSLMTLDLYFLCNLDRPDVINNLSCHLGMICLKDGAHDLGLRQTMMSDALACLLKTSSVEEADDVVVRGLKKVSQALLDNILKKLLSLKEKDQDVNMFAILNMKQLQSAGADASLPRRETMEKFYLRQVTIIITKKGNEGFSEELFSKHDKWTFLEMNRNLRNLFEELLLSTKPEDVFDLFRKMLESKEFDWKNGLMFLSASLVCFRKFSELMEGLTRKMILDSLQSQDAEGLGSAFLLTRHCCLQGQHVCMPYNVWFKKSFKEEGCLALNRKSFSFLVKFLTSILPHETENFLKAHVQNPPIVPTKSRDEWSDYVAVAKTRLSDLRSDVDVAILELEQQEAIQEAERKIESALESFNRDGRIPPSVIELSLFSRPYFVGKFLPVLLRPRLLPVAPDDRMKLVSALSRSQKIPSSMLQKYESECKRLALELVEGVIGLGDDDDDDGDVEMQLLQLPLLEQLKISLKNLQDSVLSGSNESLTKRLSDVSEKLSSTSKNRHATSKSSTPPVIDLSKYQINQGELCQAAHAILEFILQTCFLCRESNRNAWLDELILMLSNHEDVLGHVYRVAGNLISTPSVRLSPCHYGGLAELFFQRIRADPEIYGVVKFGNGCFLEYVEDLVRFVDTEGLRRSIEFVCSYVALVSRRRECTKPAASAKGPREPSDFFADSGPVPRSFVDILTFGLPKIDGRLRSSNDDVAKLLESMEDGDPLGFVSDVCFVENVFGDTMTFKKWAEYEVGCEEVVEDFSVVEDYYSWVVNSGKYVLSDDHWGERTRLEGYCAELFEALCSRNKTTSKSCFECRKDLRKGKEDKFLCFVYLLQSLASQVCVDHTHPPWMWEGIDKVLENHAEGLHSGATDRARRFSESSSVEKILRLVTKLPATLLVSNSSVAVGTAPETVNGGLSRLISFINSKLRNLSSSSIPVLNFNFTLHLLRCLSHVDSSDLKNFFTKAPLFTFSVFLYWKSILLSDVCRKDCPLKCIFDEIRSSNFPVDPRIAAALFLGLEKNSVEVFGISLEIASCIHRVIRDAEAASFLSVSNKLEPRPDLFVQLFKCNLSGNVGKLLSLILPDFVHSFWSCALVSMFVHLSEKERFCRSSALDVDFLNSILTCYKDFNDFFDTPGLDHQVLCSQPFAAIGQTSQALVKYLVAAPKIKFKEISEDVLNCCDVLIKSCILKYRK